MIRAFRIARSIAVGAAIVMYAVLAHRVNASGAVGLQGALLALAPLLLVGLALLGNPRTRLVGAAVTAVLGVLLWSAWPAIARHAGLLFWLQDIGLLLTLLATFGLTLLGDRKPLCVTFAEMAHGTPLPLAHMAYARQVTVAWTVFFALLAVISTLLFLLAPLAVWSFYANFLVLPLIALMFVAEYLVRRRVLAGEAGHLLDGVDAYLKSTRSHG